MFVETRPAQIMFAAQNMADAWLRNPSRGPFEQAAILASSKLWPGDQMMPNERAAFIAAADLARLGRGHAINNPDPLMREIERRLRISNVAR